jgi:hypothetical protein
MGKPIISTTVVTLLEYGIWASSIIQERNLSFLSSHKMQSQTKESYRSSNRYRASYYAYKSSSAVSSTKAALPVLDIVLELPPGAPPSGNLKEEPKDLDCCRFCKERNY